MTFRSKKAGERRSPSEVLPPAPPTFSGPIHPVMFRIARLLARIEVSAQNKLAMNSNDPIKTAQGNSHDR